MDFPAQETSLSFSIENILRDDFPKQRRPRPSNAANFPAFHPSFGRSWPSAGPSAPMFRCYAVRYSPVFLRFLPNMQRMGARIHQENRVKGLILAHQPQRILDEDRLSCDDEKDEGSKHDEDDIEENDVNEESEPEKCSKEKTPERKRRNRSHFTQYQLQYLEKIFSRQQYLTRDERTILARGLDMTELQIRNWFQNRRYHKKHRANEDTKLEEKTDSSMCETNKV